MVQTLDQLVSKLGPAKAAAPVKEPPNPATLPYWVVVVNPRRVPPQPKYYFGYATEKEANVKADEQNAKADEQARDESVRRGTVWLPFRYHVIARPEEGKL